MVHPSNDSDWTDDESSSSTSSSDFFGEEICKISTAVNNKPVKTKGELDLEDLPPIQDLCISVNDNELTKIGIIHGCVGKQVVVQALKDTKPLDIDSVLFLSPEKPLGRIFEVFGPVVEPFYIVLYNTPEEIIDNGVTIGTDVYFAPEKSELTSYVFVDILRKQKGSDASWKDNNEPPDEYLDYSDDEQERIAKQKRRGKNRGRNEDDEVQILSVNKILPVSVVESRRNDSFNHNLKRFRKDPPFTPSSSNNFSQHLHNTRKSFNNDNTPVNDTAMFNHSFSRKSNNLDNVPVWITSPPAFLQPKPIATPQRNVCVTPPIQPLHVLQPSSPHQSPQFESFQLPQSQIVSPPNSTFSKQQFVPCLPANYDRSSTLFQTPPPRSSSYFPTIPAPVHQQVQQNLSQSPFPQHSVQPYTFGQVSPVTAVSHSAFSVSAMSPSPSFPIATMAPSPSFSMEAISPSPSFSRSAMSPSPSFSRSAMSSTPSFSVATVPNTPTFPMAGFSPCPSPLLFTPPNNVTPLFVTTPPPRISTSNPYWQERGEYRSSISSQIAPSSNPPLTVQAPSFGTLPPFFRFAAPNNNLLSQPQFSQNNYPLQQSNQPAYRF